MTQVRALIGPASLLESDDRPAWWTPPWAPRRLEAVIGSDNGDGTLTIRHWFRGQARPDNPWLVGDVISAAATGPASLDQRGRPGSDSHELVAVVPEPDGRVEYAWPVNSSAPGRWRRVGPTGDDRHRELPRWDGPDGADEWGAGRLVAVATAATRLRSGWVQALAQVDGSLYHLHRQQRPAGVRWLRQACLVLDDRTPFATAERPSVKIAQVSGERDSQPGRPGVTLSGSESRSGVRGTDLGVRIEHGGRSFLLCGDTHWARRPWLGTRDSIAEIEDGGGEDLPRVRFHGAPLAVRGGGTTLREYDVPLDAFSLDGELYALFTSDHFRDAQVMGRCVLARARTAEVLIDPAQRMRPVVFEHLATLSDHRFINVSVRRDDDVLWVWGTGAYRADDVRLARVDLAAPGVRDGLRAGDAASFLAALRYWAAPLVEAAETQEWSPHESDARPLFTPGAVGELSVRWVPELGRYLMLTMSGPGDPIGAAVVLRTAPKPWGPWSPRLKLFDWITAGMSFGDPSQRFIKALADGSDPVGDAIFRGQANATGGAYAPYFFDLRPDAEGWLLRYTLSTWNPYQVVLMQHRLTPADLVVTSHSV